MQGNQIIALLIGILLLIVSIGWLVFCWYRRHVNMGVMISQARARVIRERQQANYDVERGYHDSDYLVPKYTRVGWVRPKPRYADAIPKSPDYVVLRRLDRTGGLDYRARSFRHAHLSTVNGEPPRPGSQKGNEQQQAPQEEKGHQQGQQQQQQKQGKKQKKKGNQGNQGNQKNHENQNNHVNQNSPPKGKKNRKGKNKGNNEEAAQQTQENHQHENAPDNQTTWDHPNDNHDQQNATDNQDAWDPQHDNNGQHDSQSNHRYNGSRHSQSNRGQDSSGQAGWPEPTWPSEHHQGPPVSERNGKRGSNKGSQSGNSQNSRDHGRGRRQGGSWDNGHQRETSSVHHYDSGPHTRVGEWGDELPGGAW